MHSTKPTIPNKQIMETENLDQIVQEVNEICKLSTLPYTVRKFSLWQKITSPRYRFRVKMYCYFSLGTLSLLFLSWIALYNLQDYGNQTYWIYLKHYWQSNGNRGILTLLAMLVVNLFWMIINAILNYLAVSQDWIVTYKQKTDESESQTPLQSQTQTLTLSNTNRHKLIDEEEENEKKREDQAEFESLLAHPIYSVLAPFWKLIKSVYRTAESVCLKFYSFFLDLKWYWLQIIHLGKTLLLDLWEFLVYMLDPSNFFDEFLDFGLLVLVRFLYPAILTPIIFFIPIRYNYLFGTWTHSALELVFYFLIIGFLRLGMTFFSIYLRFLKKQYLQID